MWLRAATRFINTTLYLAVQSRCSSLFQTCCKLLCASLSHLPESAQLMSLGLSTVPLAHELWQSDLIYLCNSLTDKDMHYHTDMLRSLRSYWICQLLTFKQILAIYVYFPMWNYLTFLKTFSANSANQALSQYRFIQQRKIHDKEKMQTWRKQHARRFTSSKNPVPKFCFTNAHVKLLGVGPSQTTGIRAFIC